MHRDYSLITAQQNAFLFKLLACLHFEFPSSNDTSYYLIVKVAAAVFKLCTARNRLLQFNFFRRAAKPSAAAAAAATAAAMVAVTAAAAAAGYIMRAVI